MSLSLSQTPLAAFAASALLRWNSKEASPEMAAAAAAAISAAAKAAAAPEMAAAAAFANASAVAGQKRGREELSPEDSRNFTDNLQWLVSHGTVLTDDL